MRKQTRGLPFRVSTPALTLTVCAIASLASACGDVEPLEISESAQAIQRGQVETGYPEVGLVGLEGESGDCTGTLVDPSWVLTARHCQDTRAISLGTDPTNLVVHRLKPRRYFQPRSDGRLNEVTLIQLEEPVDAPVHRVKPFSLPAEGQICTAVGFGFHDEADGTKSSGKKRSSTSVVLSADSYQIATEGRSGFVDGGDSGGPLFCDGNLVGVVRSRRGTYPDRIGGLYDVIDAAWIAETIANPPPEEEPKPAAPSAPSFAPEVRLLGYSGSLCPPESLFLDQGYISGTTSEVARTDTVQRCKIRLSVTAPAGRQLTKPTFCSLLSTTQGESALSVAYSISGHGSSRFRRSIDANVESGTCDSLAVTAPTCTTPAKPVELAVTIDLSANVKAGASVNWIGLDASLSEGGGTVWSSCTPAPAGGGRPSSCPRK